MKLLLTIALSTLLTATAYSQVVVKHFNASWNKDHKVTWLTNLSDCSVKYYDLAKYPKLKTKYKIVVLPTIIIFVDGEEKKRYQANIMMEIDAKQEDLQEFIDQSIMSNF